MDPKELKPKNQTLDTRKKAERVFIPELHSHPELMSVSEKLELAEELLSEVLSSFLRERGVCAEVLDVEGAEIVMELSSSSLEIECELQSLVKVETGGVFSARFL